MVTRERASMSDIVGRDEEQLLPEWIQHQLASTTLRRDLLSEEDLQAQSRRFLGALPQGPARTAAPSRTSARTAWAETRELLARHRRKRAPGRGSRRRRPPRSSSRSSSRCSSAFARSSNATRRRSPRRCGRPPPCSTASASTPPRSTRRAARRSILRQQQEMLELSTPVVELWDGILALPLIGTLDSARTQVVMENLLQQHRRDRAPAIAIIDITGVPTVDTLVAQHLLKTVAAARLMGAECIISGIRPQIAQTIVHLGVDLRRRRSPRPRSPTPSPSRSDAPGWPSDRARADAVRRPDGTHPDPEDGRLPAGHASRWTCTTVSR